MKRIQTIALAAIILLASGCSNNDIEKSMERNMADTPITFTAGVNTLTSRAGHPAGALESGVFGLFLSTEGTDDNANYNAKNLGVTGEDGVWTPVSKLLWKDNTTPVTYYAYMPYCDSLSGTVLRVELTAVQTEESMLAEDVLYASGENLKAEDCTDGISLLFKHKMSQLKVVLTKATELEENVEVTGVKISKCPSLGLMDLKTGELKCDDSKTADMQMYGTKVPADHAFTNTWEALLFPYTFSQGTFKVTVTVGSGMDTRSFLYTAPRDVVMEEGTSYTLNLTVGRDKVIPGGITASEWTEEDRGEIVTD